MGKRPGFGDVGLQGHAFDLLLAFAGEHHLPPFFRLPWRAETMWTSSAPTDFR